MGDKSFNKVLWELSEEWSQVSRSKVYNHEKNLESLENFNFESMFESEYELEKFQKSFLNPKTKQSLAPTEMK